MRAPTTSATTTVTRASRAGIARATLALLAVTGAAMPARAQFSVQPVIVEVRADTVREESLLVTNHSDEPLQVRFYVGDFDQEESGSHLFMDAGEHEATCADRIEVFPNGALVPPRGEQVVRVRLQPDAALCWSVVFAETAKRDSRGLLIGQRIGVKVYGVPETAGRDGMIEAVNALPGGDSVQISFAFRNTGASPVRPHGEVEIRSIRGDPLQTIGIEAFSVLPGHVRVVRLRTAAPAAAGRYVVVPVLEFGGDYLAGGQGILEIDP